MLDLLQLKRLFEGKYKYYILLPFVLALVFLFVIMVFPGLPQGIDITGGTLLILRVDKQINSSELEQLLSKEFDIEDLTVTTTSGANSYGVVIQFAHEKNILNAENAIKKAKEVLISNPNEARMQAENAISFIARYYVPKPEDKPEDIKDFVLFASDAVDKAKEVFQGRIQQKIRERFLLSSTTSFQISEIGPTIGPVFWNNAIFVTIIAMIAIIIVIFAFFREFIPSMAIILAAIFDVLTALAFMAILRIPLSLASIPALLMLVGYSVDTDITLTTKLMKRKHETPSFRAAEAMRTGLTMTFTAIAAAAIMMVFAYYNQMLVMFQIATVLFFGLLGDIVSTWLMNAPVLLWYIEGKTVKSRR